MTLVSVLGCNSRTCQGAEYPKPEKIHRSDMKRPVEKGNEAEFDQVI